MIFSLPVTSSSRVSRLPRLPSTRVDRQLPVTVSPLRAALFVSTTRNLVLIARLAEVDAVDSVATEAVVEVAVEDAAASAVTVVDVVVDVAVTVEVAVADVVAEVVRHAIRAGAQLALVVPPSSPARK